MRHQTLPTLSSSQVLLGEKLIKPDIGVLPLGKKTLWMRRRLCAEAMTARASLSHESDGRKDFDVVQEGPAQSF